MALSIGVPAPSFVAPSPENPRYQFNSLGGRYVVLAFLPPPGEARDAALREVQAHAALFASGSVTLFGVLPDAESYAEARNRPPWRWFADMEGELRRLYDATAEDGSVQPCWVVVDPSMRIMGSAPLAMGAMVFEKLAELGDPDRHAGVPMHAPVLIVPRVFEPPLCRRLIDYYRGIGGSPSGVMRVVDGKTVPVLDNFKRRRDVTIADAALQALTRARITERLIPEIRKVFQFRATRLERYIVACYDAEEGGYFNPHRDNTTPGTAHRKFAVSINLNAEEFEGGDLRFPEFGRRTYRPPTGGAVVFSCSLLHEATRVQSGTRFAFLPFLYDEAGAEIRRANLHTFEGVDATAPSGPQPAAIDR
ncbi:MAG: 2OG-Fe(II) oxygenase [Caulobacteraceae bacterium]